MVPLFVKLNRIYENAWASDLLYRKRNKIYKKQIWLKKMFYFIDLQKLFEFLNESDGESAQIFNNLFFSLKISEVIIIKKYYSSYKYKISNDFYNRCLEIH